MGFYNMATGRRADHQGPRAELRDQRQLPPGGAGRHRRQPHRARHRVRGLATRTRRARPRRRPANEIENPNPKPGTNNNYTQDGYAGGSYSECANSTAPGVSAIDKYLATLPYKPLANCQPGRYYLLNNYNAGYNVDGTVNTSPFTVPPQKTDYVTIGNELSAHHISWGYFGEGYNNGHPNFSYCGICDPMQYSSSIMTNPALRKNVQHGLANFVSKAAHGNAAGGVVPQAR